MYSAQNMHIVKQWCGFSASTCTCLIICTYYTEKAKEDMVSFLPTVLLILSFCGKPNMLLRSVTTSTTLYREISQSLSAHLCVVAHPSHMSGLLTFSLKRRKSEPSQVVLCCLALFIVSPLFNHVHVHDHVHWEGVSTEVVQHTAMMEHCAVLCYSTHCMPCAALAAGAHICIFPCMHIGLIGLKLHVCVCLGDMDVNYVICIYVYTCTCTSNSLPQSLDKTYMVHVHVSDLVKRYLQAIAHQTRYSEVHLDW